MARITLHLDTKMTACVMQRSGPVRCINPAATQRKRPASKKVQSAMKPQFGDISVFIRPDLPVILRLKCLDDPFVIRFK